MDGNFSDYLKKFQEKYEELRKQGRDLYIVRSNFPEYIISLPRLDRMEKRDGGLLLTLKDMELLMRHFPNESENMAGVKIFPYTGLEKDFVFTLSNLETILKEGISKVSLYMD